MSIVEIFFLYGTKTKCPLAWYNYSLAILAVSEFDSRWVAPYFLPCIKLSSA